MCVRACVRVRVCSHLQEGLGEKLETEMEIGTESNKVGADTGIREQRQRGRETDSKDREQGRWRLLVILIN